MLETLLAQAWSLHQQGQWRQAQGLYQQVLVLDPHHFDALHLLGALAYQTSEPLQAVALLEQRELSVCESAKGGARIRPGGFGVAR